MKPKNKNSIGKHSTLNENFQPAEIITRHIQRIMEDEDIESYIADIEKLEDLLTTEMDDEYEKEEKTIKKDLEEFTVPVTVRLNRENHNEYKIYKESKKRQYKMRRIFRALVKLAKRKGLWLMDEEDGYISHDKKKATCTDGRS